MALLIQAMALMSHARAENDSPRGDTPSETWRATASVAALTGRDSNVFLAEGSRHKDHMAEARLEGAVEGELGAWGELYTLAEGRERRYFDQQRANERSGSLYAEWTRPLEDPDLAFTLDAFIMRQSARLFDAQGALAPRGRWAALDSSTHAQAAWSDWDPFVVELGGGLLRSNLRENGAQESLDYRDRLLDSAWRWYPGDTWSLGLSGQWTWRRYDERARRGRDGFSLGPGRPLRLDLPSLRLEARAEPIEDLAYTVAATRKEASDNGDGYFDFKEWGLHAGIEYEVAKGSRIEIAGSWRRRDFSRRALLTRPGRERERLADGTIALSRVAWPRSAPDLDVVLSVSWFGLHARERGQSHRRTVIFVGLRYRWRSGP